MGNLFSKKKPVAEEGTPSTVAENKKEEKDSTPAVAAAESADQDAAISAVSEGQDVILSEDSIKQEAGAAGLSPQDSVSQDVVTPAGEKKQSDEACPELHESAPNAAVSVEHSERFRTEQRTKVTTPIEILESAFSESSLKHTENVSPEHAAHPDSDRIHSPVIEPFEHLTFDSAPTNESVPPSTAHAPHDESSLGKTQDVCTIDDSKPEREDAPALVIQFGGSTETPKIDTPTPEPENATSVLIDFGSPIEKIVDVVQDDDGDKKGSLINTDEAAYLGIGDVGPPESSNSTEVVTPISIEN